jgi:peptidoglycan DL-endopeptidase LytE
MRGRSCITVFFALIALLVISHLGLSKAVDNSHKASAKRNTAKSAPLKKHESKSRAEYSVRAGDSLSRIAQRFGTTVEAVRTANGLKSDRLKIGQILRVPNSKNVPIKKETLSVAVHAPNETYITAGSVPETETVEPPSTRLRLVQAGFQLIGVRYKFSGGSEKSGFDCSGLVKSLFSKFDIDLPRSSREQFQQGQKVSKDELQLGDLVFFSSGGNQPTHVGIYVGNNQILHAARKAKQVIVTDISKIWNSMRYLGARRVMDLWGDDPAPEPTN